MQTSHRVLVVDDSDHMRILVSRLLKQRGFQEIDTAVNGKVALEKVKTSHPDIIFLDAVMPEIGGRAVLSEVKKEHPDIVVVIMSSISACEEIVQFRDAGADFYLLKPFESDKFGEVIEKVLAIVQAHKEG